MHTQRLVLWPSVVAGALIVLASATAVFAAAPAVSYTASGSTPGATLAMSGSGFQPGETVSLSFGLSSATAVVDSAGSFSGASLTIPNVSSGLYYVIAVGQTSGMVAFNSIWVNSFFATAGPSSWYITPGSSITWSGAGFSPNETVTLRDGAGATLATWTANGSGSFSGAGSTVAPFTARNSAISYTLRGSTSGANLSFTLAVADLYPWANPSSWYAAPGTSVTFSGGGFGAGETLNLMLGTSTAVLASATVDSNGNFTGLGPVNLPFGATANYRIVGASSGAVVNAPITLSSFYPSLTPSSYYSAPGGLITLSGTGFAGNEPVSVNVGGVAMTATTDNTGAFSIPSVQVPATPNTPASISAVGGLSGAATSFTMAIGQYYPDITPSFWFSYPGDTITFSGSGFAPNETLTVSGAGSGTITTDSLGKFSGFTGTLPSSNATYTFTGSKSITPFSVTIALGERYAGIWYDNYWGVGGSALTVFGAGFGNGESVALTYGSGNASMGTVTAGSDGSFTYTTTMPYAPAGPLMIKAKGASTNTSASAETNVAPIWPSLSFGSYSVAPGTALNIIGSGYLANEPMEVIVGGSVAGTFTADASGSFNNSSVNLPSVPEGLTDITVRGTYSHHSSTITIWAQGSSS